MQLVVVMAVRAAVMAATMTLSTSSTIFPAFIANKVYGLQFTVYRFSIEVEAFLDDVL